MALKAVLQTLDDVEAELRPLYVEKDGRISLDLESIDEHPLVKNLKSAHESVKNENRKVKGELKIATDKLAFLPGDFDLAEVNFDEIARLMAEDEARQKDPNNKDERQKIETATAAVRQQWETKLALAQRKADGEIKTRDEKISSLSKTIRGRLVDDYLTKSLTDAGVTSPPLLKAAKALHAPSVEVIEEDGDHRAQMTNGFDIATWTQTDEGKVFVTPPTGGNLQGNVGNRGRVSEKNPYTAANWNLTEQGRLLRTDRATADRLARAAGFMNLESANKAAGPKQPPLPVR